MALGRTGIPARYNRTMRNGVLSALLLLLSVPVFPLDHARQLMGVDEAVAKYGVQGRGVLFDFVRAFGRGRTLVGYDKLMQVITDQRSTAAK